MERSSRSEKVQSTNLSQLVRVKKGPGESFEGNRVVMFGKKVVKEVIVERVLVKVVEVVERTNSQLLICKEGLPDAILEDINGRTKRDGIQKFENSVVKLVLLFQTWKQCYYQTTYTRYQILLQRNVILLKQFQQFGLVF